MKYCCLTNNTSNLINFGEEESLFRFSILFALEKVLASFEDGPNPCIFDLGKHREQWREPGLGAPFTMVGFLGTRCAPVDDKFS